MKITESLSVFPSSIFFIYIFNYIFNITTKYFAKIVDFLSCNALALAYAVYCCTADSVFCYK